MRTRRPRSRNPWLPSSRSAPRSSFDTLALLDARSRTRKRCPMNIHEYQAKALLAEYGVKVLPGRVAYTPEEAEQAARGLGGTVWVVKAQIHAGGRGKGGGVKLAKSVEETRQLAD